MLMWCRTGWIIIDVLGVVWQLVDQIDMPIIMGVEMAGTIIDVWV